MTSDGPATGGRGYLATAASRFSSWWSGERRPPALTADTASGAGLQGGNDDVVPSSNGDANSAPLEGDITSTPSDLRDIGCRFEAAVETTVSLQKVGQVEDLADYARLTGLD